MENLSNAVMPEVYAVHVAADCCAVPAKAHLVADGTTAVNTAIAANREIAVIADKHKLSIHSIYI